MQEPSAADYRKTSFMKLAGHLWSASLSISTSKFAIGMANIGCILPGPWQ